MGNSSSTHIPSMHTMGNQHANGVYVSFFQDKQTHRWQQGNIVRLLIAVLYILAHVVFAFTFFLHLV
jgi:hypothetical protein